MKPHGIYLHSCPNCGGIEDDWRLSLGLPCHDCLPNVPEKPEKLGVAEIYRLLREYKKLDRYADLYKLQKRLEKLEEFFHKATGSRFWSAQRTWAKRVLKNRSFAIIAPTGVGKTSFGIITALYFAIAEHKKSYIVLPTTPLVLQVESRLNAYNDKLGGKARIIAIHARLSSKEKRERLDKLLSGDFDVLVTTSRFLQARFNDVSRHKYKFIFVDDVDAVLKSSKSVDLVLKLVGFSDEDINIGIELIKAKRELARLITQDKREQAEKISKKIERMEKYIERVREKIGSILVVSSATGRPRGARVKLFRELLGFEAGSRSEVLRNIIDSYTVPAEDKSLEDVVAWIVKILGTGGLVYVPVDKGIEYAEKLAEYLRSKGINADALHSKKLKSLELFKSGELDVLVGVAVYYGVMVRGLDLPERIRYAVFAGVPRLKFTTEFEDPHPINIVRALGLLAEVAPEDSKMKIASMLARMRRLLQRLSPAAIQQLAEELRRGEKPSLEAAAFLLEALSLIRELLARKDVQEALRRTGEVAIVEEDNKTYILIPDVMTYIQASGRTSRLYAGGITHGLSVVVADDQRLLNGLIKRSKWIIDAASWKKFEELDLERILRVIDEDRRKVREVLEGKVKPELVDLVKTALMVVESPNKARTIANFFGKPSVRLIGDLRVYEVSTGDYVLLITASGGHVYDLLPSAKKYMGKVPVKPLGEYFGVLYSKHPESKGMYAFYPVYNSIKRCLACGYQFTEDTDKCPYCGGSLVRDSSNIIKAIQDVATEVDYILVGTDPDTEGEKIGWDIACLLRPYTKNVLRIEFHEVTRKAILEAIKNPRGFNNQLVEAQLVRRIEDRWIGFSLSPILWRVFWPDFCKTHLGLGEERCRENRRLSAGRVQTPVLGWIVDRDIEHQKSFKIFYTIYFEDEQVTVSEDVIGLMKAEELRGKTIRVVEVERRVEELKPLPPFTTDTLITEASARLRLGATETMNLAQELFEMGFITYHRTDSTRVSDAGIAIAREYLVEKYGDKYKDLFAPRTWGVGGAHEAIRPTRPIDAERLKLLVQEGIIQPVRPLTSRHYALYDLIFRRFIASQMVSGKVEKQVVDIIIEKGSLRIERTIRIIEPGFLDIYPIRLEKELKPGEHAIRDVIRRRRSTVPLYTQGDVVRLMKERGIGRPSTYAKIVQTLLQRKYVLEIGKRTKFLKPTKLGIHVRDFLVKRFGPLVSENRTRQLEEIMDSIEEGKREYQEVLNEVYLEILDAIKPYISRGVYDY